MIKRERLKKRLKHLRGLNGALLFAEAAFVTSSATFMSLAKIGAGWMFFSLWLAVKILRGYIKRVLTISYQVIELYGVLKAIYHSFRFPQEDLVRITLYIKRRKVFRPVVPYFPRYTDDAEYNYYGSFKKGIDVGKGGVGKCYELNRDESDSSVYFFYMKIQDPSQRNQELMDSCNFSQSDLRSMRGDRMSYWAMPIKDRRNKTLGILYMDSANANSFDSEKRSFQALNFMELLVNYIRKRGENDE